MSDPIPVAIHRVPFSDDLLQRLADDLAAPLLESRDDPCEVLILLPSTRACRTLGAILLESGGRDAIALPRIQTAEQWAKEAALAMGRSPLGLPDDRARSIILTRGLEGLPWLADRPENAPALADEFLAFFDEARIWRRDGMLLDARTLDAALEKAEPGEASIAAADLGRAREAWSLYRDAIEADSVDFLVGTADALAARRQGGERPPGRGRRLVCAAGFGRVDPVRADVLRAALASGDEARLYSPALESRVSRLFAATWPAAATRDATDPLAAARDVELQVTGTLSEPPPAADRTTLQERLARFDDGSESAVPVELSPCGDPEAESRVVADRVALLLNDAVESGSDLPRIGIATNDTDLAGRIAAQLTDAGIELDNTHGRPLAVQPAGLLLRFLLRAAMTDLRAEPLLEVLTHPYVRIETSEGGHERWTLQLERMFRRDSGPEGGLSGLYRRAEDRDAAALDLFGRKGPGLLGFVTAIADAFEPLRAAAAAGRTDWAALARALETTWTRLCAGNPLEPKSARFDIPKARQLLDDLHRESHRLPLCTLGEFAAELNRLLANENVAPHRVPNLPVLLTGLVEARLERFDHLILAGMREGVFPRKKPRPLLVPGRMRRRLGLPGWQIDRARDAELFLRLVHNAPRVAITWPAEDQGQPVLPSPFVSRLALGLGDLPAPDAGERRWRTEPVPRDEIDARQAAFAAEPIAVPAFAAARAPEHLSWSALRTWRDCPYRYLLERGFVLRKPDEVRAEFGRKEYGSLVHEILKQWLDPAGPGYAAVAAGDAAGAEEQLRRAAREHFLPGAGELPVRKLWLESFVRLAPVLAATEVERFADWRPVALEKDFQLPLARLVGWIHEQARPLGVDPELPPADALPDFVAGAGLCLAGIIDRVDRTTDGTGALAVIDYKTGTAPTAKSVKDLEELQVPLYAAVLEAGAPGDEPVGVSFGIYYPLKGDKAGKLGKPHLDATGDDGRRLLVSAAAAAARLALAAANPAGPFELIPAHRAGEGKGGLPCRYCDLRGVCRLEERSGLGADAERKLDKLIGQKEGFGS